MKVSTFCQPALTCYETQGQYIEDITRWCEDMNIRVYFTSNNQCYHRVISDVARFSGQEGPRKYLREPHCRNSN